ncbi:MAG: hypothetical protein M0Z66_05545 [Thermaerobacter sp.]|nr:hypothetical protein [Thermaerobacter sp.]
MSSPITVTVTRTVRLRIAPSVDAGTFRAIENTQAEWGKAVRFYTDLFSEHPTLNRPIRLLTGYLGSA